LLVKLEAYHDGECWCARGIGVSVFTQGETFEALLENARDALALHFEETLDQGELLQVLILTETEVRGVSKASAG
jgi:hypothetical protein